jgi:hypothetical protein
LIGSFCSVRARGEAREDSDYDVAVFVKSLDDRWEELDRLADLRVRLLEETGAFFDAKPYLATAYEERTPLMRARNPARGLGPVTPETELYLAKAHRLLADAETMPLVHFTTPRAVRPSLPDSMRPRR